MDKNLLLIKKECLEIKQIKEKLSNKLSNLRLIIFLTFILFLIVYFKNHTFYSLLLTSISIITFIIIIVFHTRINKEIHKVNSYLTIIKKYENRNQDTWKDEKYDHQEVEDNFLNDLNIIGKNSLLQYLDFTKSLGGKRNLITSLSLEDINKNNILSNQLSIKELKENPKFILNFQYLMTKIENINKIDYKEYFYLFDVKKKIKSKDLIISVIFSILTVVNAILTLFNIVNSYFFLILFFLQILTSYIYIFIYKEEFDNINKYTRNFKGLKEIFTYIESQKFNSNRNNELQKNIIKGKNTLKEIIKLSSIDSFRLNFISYIVLNVFCSLNFIILHKYYKLLNTRIDEFKQSILALEEFEKLISLTTIALVKKEISMPEITDELSINFQLAKHPLLNEKNCIANSFKSEKDLNIITGSNMSGKTSFMKTIGVNLILAYNGTFVNAKKFSCSINQIFTSINVKDDITNGISTFYGELKRIRNILDFSEKSNKNMIIFIDEIFKGTNYNDRILGAKETLKQLSNLNCIVFLTTHDFELCEIENKKIRNYHFSETYEDKKIKFDYKIKTGQCKTTNAKYLMKEMGIISE